MVGTDRIRAESVGMRAVGGLLEAYLGCRIDVNNGIKAIGSRVKALMRFVDLLSTR